MNDFINTAATAGFVCIIHDKIVYGTQYNI